MVVVGGGDGIIGVESVVDWMIDVKVFDVFIV